MGLAASLPLAVYNSLALFTCELCGLGLILLVYFVRPLWNRGLQTLAAISYELYISHGYFIGLVNRGLPGLLLFTALTLAAAVALLFVTKGARGALGGGHWGQEPRLKITDGRMGTDREGT